MQVTYGMTELRMYIPGHIHPEYQGRLAPDIIYSGVSCNVFSSAVE
jgi:hypothetical protein